MTNKELVQTAFDNFTKGNIPAIVDLLADDISWKMNGPADVFPYAGSRKGKAEVMDFFAQIAATSDFEVFKATDYIAEGDKVVALGEAVATNKQTGKTSHNQWAMYWTFNNGKVTYYQNFSDTYDIAQSFIK